MTPEPPYGADLSRGALAEKPYTYAARVWAALDAANAEVLRLRAEVEALTRSWAHAAEGLQAAQTERDALRAAVEAVRFECQVGARPGLASDILEAILPAPTEGDG